MCCDNEYVFIEGNPELPNDDKYNIKDSWDYGNIILYSAERDSDKHLYSMNYERMKQKLKEKQVEGILCMECCWMGWNIHNHNLWSTKQQ